MGNGSKDARMHENHWSRPSEVMMFTITELDQSLSCDTAISSPSSR